MEKSDNSIKTIGLTLLIGLAILFALESGVVGWRLLQHSPLLILPIFVGILAVQFLIYIIIKARVTYTRNSFMDKLRKKKIITWLIIIFFWFIAIGNVVYAYWPSASDIRKITGEGSFYRRHRKGTNSIFALVAAGILLIPVKYLEEEEIKK